MVNKLQMISLQMTLRDEVGALFNFGHPNYEAFDISISQRNGNWCARCGICLKGIPAIWYICGFCYEELHENIQASINTTFNSPIQAKIKANRMVAKLKLR